MLLMWLWNDRALSRMKPILLTGGEGETEELLMEIQKLSALNMVDLLPMFSFIAVEFEKVGKEPEFKFSQAVSKGRGWESGVGFSGEAELGVIRVAVKIYTVFLADIIKGEEICDEQQGLQD